MALPKVLFNIAKDGLGRTTAIQKTTGLIVTGVTVSGKVELGQVVTKIFSLKRSCSFGVYQKLKTPCLQAYQSFL